MKSTARRPRSDSAAAAVRTVQNAASEPIAPPACITLRPQDRPFWDRIIRSKARDNWTEIDLVSAGHLARALADIEGLQAMVDAEGYIVADKISPAARAQELLQKRCTTLAAAIQVHALATVGKARNAVESATAEREAREQEDDPLLPKLYVL